MTKKKKEQQKLDDYFDKSREMRKYLIVAFMSLLLLAGCGSEKYERRFKKGDYVVTKLDGRKGMVIRNFINHDGIYVRFASKTDMTTSGLLGGTYDVTSKPYAEVYMHEFKLMPFVQ